jgi:hypothetical protein
VGISPTPPIRQQLLAQAALKGLGFSRADKPQTQYGFSR